MSDLHATPGPNGLRVEVSTRGTTRLVHLIGELDLASATTAIDACVQGRWPQVTVDLGRLTFMDCSGYGGLVSARLAVVSRGGILEWRHAVAQPARLLEMLGAEADGWSTTLGDSLEGGALSS